MKKIEINDIFRIYRDAFLEKYGDKISTVQYKALNAIVNCRTAALGGHVEKCDTCEDIFIKYNSCRNRHCPKCQNVTKAEWLLKRKRDILPIRYYHVISTLPHMLNGLVYINQKILLDIFIKSVITAIKILGKECTRHLGAEPGIVSILHTWGQKLMYHIHLHSLITAGGLSMDKKRWIPCRYKNYFMPSAVISQKVKEIFVGLLKKEYDRKDSGLRLTGADAYLKRPFEFKKFIAKLESQKWVIHCTPPYKRPETVIDYFGGYSHRVAISNHRIIKLADDQVYFTWKDYKAKKKNGTRKYKWREASLPAVDFMRRFLLHILPKRFVKIRYSGFLANGYRARNLAICREILKAEINIEVEKLLSTLQETEDKVLLLLGIDMNVCPSCNEGRLKAIRELKPDYQSHSPPAKAS